MHPVGGIGVGRVGPPPPDGIREVGDPQAVPPTAGGPEQGQLRAGVGPLAAGEDPHPLGPAGQLVVIGVRPQDSGQLGDAPLLDPAPLMCALTVTAGVLGAALTHLAR